MESRRVLLVDMPFAAVVQPSIALGLLKACLDRRGITADVDYLNIAFAERIGFDAYEGVSLQYNAFLGEWLFSADLFAADAVPEQKYLQNILRRRYKKFFTEERIQEILDIRALVPHFLDQYLESKDWESYFLVGFTSCYQQTVPSLALARRLKALHPEISIVLGGANCEGEMGVTLLRRFSFLDAVFSGEADETFPRFVERRRSGQSIGELAGVFHRCNGKLSAPKHRAATVADLDEIPAPDYGDYFDQLTRSTISAEVGAHQNVWAPESPQALAQTSRGCWWGEKAHCTFCGLNGKNMRFRSKSPDRAVEELTHLYRRYGSFLLCVDNILDPAFVEEVFPRLARECPGVGLFYEVKADLSKDELRRLSEAGVKFLQPGIESLSTSILSLVHKGTTLPLNLQFLKWCKELDIRLVWPFLWGIAGEQPEEYAAMAELIPKITHLPPPSAVIKVQLHRFTPYFWWPERFGITEARPHPAYAHIFPFPESELSDLAYYFTFKYADGRRPKKYAAPMIQAAQQWDRDHDSSNLSYRRDGEQIVVRSSKEGNQASFVLRGRYAEVFDACDSVQTVPTLAARLGPQHEPDVGPSGLTQLLQALIERDLLISDRGTYLALPTFDPGTEVGGDAEVLS